jgi:hypothetical protein
MKFGILIYSADTETVWGGNEVAEFATPPSIVSVDVNQNQMILQIVRNAVLHAVNSVFFAANLEGFAYTR